MSDWNANKFFVESGWMAARRVTFKVEEGSAVLDDLCGHVHASHIEAVECGGTDRPHTVHIGAQDLLGSTVYCAKCLRATTQLEVSTRLFNEGRSACCNEALLPEPPA